MEAPGPGIGLAGGNYGDVQCMRVGTAADTLWRRQRLALDGHRCTADEALMQATYTNMTITASKV